MIIFDKIKKLIQNFMHTRYGADLLSKHILLTGLVIYIISNIISSIALGVLSLMLYIFVLFRVFSTNRVKRFEENQKYMNVKEKFSNALGQFVARMKNSKEYKYFKCPACKTRLRIKKHQGEVRVVCNNCKFKFDAKA